MPEQSVHQLTLLSAGEKLETWNYGSESGATGSPPLQMQAGDSRWLAAVWTAKALSHRPLAGLEIRQGWEAVRRGRAGTQPNKLGLAVADSRAHVLGIGSAVHLRSPPHLAAQLGWADSGAAARGPGTSLQSPDEPAWPDCGGGRLWTEHAWVVGPS